MSFTYAIGDLHGRLDVLEACLVKIEQDRLKKGDADGGATTIVFLGDYVDRGPDSRGVVQRLIDGAGDQAKWVILSGNHEQMALMAHDAPDAYRNWWCANGGVATLQSYGGRVIDPAHLEWMRGLTDRYIDEHRLFVHAGVKKDVPLELNDRDIVMWVRHGRNDEVGVEGLYTVHGHTPFMDGPVVLETRCNLDTKAYRTGRAAIAIFDDDQAGKPLDMLIVSLGYTHGD